MANEEQLAILEQGVEVWNKWRGENDRVEIDLTGAYLSDANLREANLRGADLTSAYLIKAELVQADLTGAELVSANFTRADLDGANLAHANLMRAMLREADLVQADLSHSDLREADFIRAYLINADLIEAKLNYAELSQAILIRADLSQASLIRTNFSDANLSWAVLREANLSEAVLDGANLSHADLSQGNLFGTSLKEANLYKSDLSQAHLGRAHLAGANLSRSLLAECSFFQAEVAQTIFGSLDLGKAKGLEKVRHSGPSVIGTDTFASSKGNIHEGFLRGCGLSDWEIEEAKLYQPNLRNEAINRILYKIYDLRATQALQISPLFISYSQADGAFVDKLETQLNEKGIRFWRDIHEMKSGKMEKQIDRAIRQNPTVLLILSEHSLASDWVEHEVRTARGLEKDLGRDVLCPVALDDSWKSSPWPKRVMEQIMEYNILDFSEWKDDSQFDGMFRKLIDGLELFYKG